jgi:hypothetical protein
MALKRLCSIGASGWSAPNAEAAYRYGRDRDGAAIDESAGNLM